MPQLFTYQNEGAKWLAQQKRGLLADEMGLGKSAQAIAAADLIGAQQILVLCPAVARLNWLREWEKFSPRTLTSFAVLKAADASKMPSSGVIVCSYDLASQASVLRALSARRWDVCVLDESHFLKSRTAKRTAAVLEDLLPRATHVWALSGTPAPNHPAEMWPLLRAFGTYGDDYWTFLRRFTSFRNTPFGVQITGGKRLDELRTLMAPILLRRKKEDVMKDLPPITFGDIVVEATPVTTDTLELCFDKYATYARDRRWDVFRKDIEKETHTLETLAANVGLKTNGAMDILSGLDTQVKSLRRYVGLQKLPKIIELIKSELDANAYEKIVLFGVHRDILHGLHIAFRDYGAVLIYGGTPAMKRDVAVKKFNNKPECRVFVGQVIAAGTAISLTAAHQVMVVEADWTPANNQQAVMRCHRIGQTKPVTVRFAALAGSIDEKIQRVLKQKTRTLVQLFDTPAAPVNPFDC